MSRKAWIQESTTKMKSDGKYLQLNKEKLELEHEQ